jgi:hypothetical protein
VINIEKNLSVICSDEINGDSGECGTCYIKTITIIIGGNLGKIERY